MFITRWGSFYIWVTIALGCAGCGSPAKKPLAVIPVQGGDEIAEVHIITSAVAMNLDQNPGPDGFTAKVFVNDRQNPKPVAMKKGTLQIMMFDGNLGSDPAGTQPLKVWNFSPAELVPEQFSSRIGTGYEFSLAWGNQVPTQRRITVAARYTSPEGKSVFSPPSSITVADR